MQLRFRELVGREVVAAGGRRLGRIADLEAERVGDDLRVVALLIGPGALFGRVWSARIGGINVRPRRVPWQDVTQVGERVRLRIDRLEQDEGHTEPAQAQSGGRWQR